MRTCAIAPNCTVPRNWTITFDADPDASGIGVIAAFYTAAWLTTVILTLTYVVSDPKTFDNYGFCYLDILLVNSIQDKARSQNFKTSTFPAYKTQKALQRSILILSDGQLLGGTAMGIVALSRHCEITQYHFHIAINLVLVASLAHSMTFSFISDYVHQRTFFRSWRAVAMLLLGALCFGTWIVTGNVHWLEVYGMPTQCGYDNLGDGFGRPAVDSLVLLYWFLLRGYFFAFSILIPESRKLQWLCCYFSLGYWLACVCRWLGRWSIQSISQTQKHDRVPTASNPQAPHLDQPTAPTQRPSLSSRVRRISAISLSFNLQVLHAALYGIAQVWTSYAFALLWMCYTIAQSHMIIDSYRSTAIDNGMEGDENMWGYGQVLSMLLLVAPVVAIIETFFDTKDGDTAAEVDDLEADPSLIGNTKGCESSTGFAIDFQDPNAFELNPRKPISQKSDDDEADLSTLWPSTDDDCQGISTESSSTVSEQTDSDAVKEKRDAQKARREDLDEEVWLMQQGLWKGYVFRAWVLSVTVGLSVLIIEIGL